MASLAKINNRLIVNNISGTQVHTCPITQIPYWSDCPNIYCPANISQINPGSGGCFLQKGSPNLISVARSLKITTHEAKRRYAAGMQRIERFLQFYQWLQNWRDNTPRTKHCLACGVVLRSGNMCNNQRRCNQRRRFVQKVRCLPIRMKQLQITPAEFWQIVLAQQNNKLYVLTNNVMHRAQDLLSRTPFATSGDHHARARSDSASHPH